MLQGAGHDTGGESNNQFHPAINSSSYNNDLLARYVHWYKFQVDNTSHFVKIKAHSVGWYLYLILLMRPKTLN